MAFLRSSRDSDDSSSFVGTIYTTSSSSTVPGPGAITGKFLKLLGEKSLDLVVFVIVRNRLRTIERTLGKSPHVFRNPTGDMEEKRMNEAYDDLREICREEWSDYYPLSLQRTAAKLIHDIAVLRLPVEQFLPLDASPGQTIWKSLLVDVKHLLPPQGLESQVRESSHRTPSLVVMLGAGGVGKSTFVKQIPGASMLHDTETYRDAIIKDTIVSLIDIFSDLKPSDLSEDSRNTFQQTKDAIQQIFDGRSSKHDAQAIGGAIWLLWHDPAVRRAVRRSKLGTLSEPGFEREGSWFDGKEPGFESIDYFLESAYRVFKSDYTPTHEDIVRCCIRTIGIDWGTRFRVKENHWSFIDTGGQMSERKKWRLRFENSTDLKAIVFVVALSDYNRTLSEDSSVNRMEDSLALFESTVNAHWFTNTLMVLLFNKFDLFVEKLPIVPLEDYFPDYTGQDVDDACKYFERRFLSVVKEKTKPIIVEYGTAVNTEEIRVIFQSIQDKINEHYERNIYIL